MRDTEYRPFAYLAWSGAVGVVLLIGIVLCGAVIDRLNILYMEAGPLENMSLALWLLSAFAAAAAYRRWTGKVDRLVAFWVAAMSCLAALREADAHHLLNPDVIGRIGVHYRIEWVLDPGVSILLKVGYALLFLPVVAVGFVPLLRLRGGFGRLARAGDAAVGMLIVAGVGVLLGYIMDDVLRGCPFMRKAVRQLIEETGEFAGALAFCAASLLFWRMPLSGRLQRVPRKAIEAKMFASAQSSEPSL